MTTNIDLLYLTNYLDNKKIKEKEIKKKEIKFYKKRILQVTKDLLKGEKITEDVNSSYNDYIRTLIDHFKFIDKKDIIQEEYQNLNYDISLNIDNSFNMMEMNEMMIKKVEVKEVKTMDDYILKRKKKKEKKMEIPKKKEYNIKDKKFKTKGLRKKNSKIKNLKQ
tara:strand:- start:948 stop:1442 length:495 start_codon:yes stop_codon:yes gene_type:complete